MAVLAMKVFTYGKKMCLVSFSKEESYSAKNKLTGFDLSSPKWAYIEITSACSHKCSWCYGGFNLDPSDFMTVSEFQTILEKCKEIGITQITLSGGEPTEHPDFYYIMELACADFDVHIATHGDWKEDFASQMMIQGVSQVQFNYQGSKWHNRIHGVDSYDAQIRSIQDVKGVRIDTVGTVTVGEFNLKNIPEIFSEIQALDIDRIRVWESTGYGNSFRKGKSAKEIFEICQNEASKLGYKFTQSYDPDFESEIGVKCLSLSKLFMYIKADSSILYCGAVPSLRDKPLANFKIHSAKEILDKYTTFIDSMSNEIPYCAARSTPFIK